MTETNNFNKICNIAMNSNSDILEELTDGQIGRIKFDPEHVYVVYATDEMFSGWGMSKDKLNHVFVLCWSVEQADAIESSFNNIKSMKRVSRCRLDTFFTRRHGGTWSFKNANNSQAWNKGVIV